MSDIMKLNLKVCYCDCAFCVLQHEDVVGE